MIDPTELSSLIGSPFAKQKADAVIGAAARWMHAADVDDEYPDVDLEAEHDILDYRLVPRQLLEQALESLQVVSENYRKLMEEMAPLILEAAVKPGSKWNHAAKLLGEAVAWDADNLPCTD